MKRLLALILVLALAFSMSACCMKHEFSEATCTEPAACTKCGETEGEALGHDWVEADCEHPKTCSRCGETEGEALGHDWLAASCESPETCSRCGAEQGEALGHTLVGRTTEAPGTCSGCGAEVGSPISVEKIELEEPAAAYDDRLLYLTSDGSYVHVTLFKTDKDLIITLYNDKMEIIRSDILPRTGYSYVFLEDVFFLSSNYNSDEHSAEYTVIDYAGNELCRNKISYWYGGGYMLEDTPVSGLVNIYNAEYPVWYVGIVDLGLEKEAEILGDANEQIYVESSLTGERLYLETEKVDDECFTISTPHPKYDSELWSCYRYSENSDYIFVGSKDEKQWGFLDKDGNELAMYKDCSDFGECGYALASNDCKTYFLIDTDFNVVGENILKASGCALMNGNLFRATLADGTYEFYNIG